MIGQYSMANQPLVSVIVPTYNRPAFLKRTLQSILAQTYKNIEIIVVSNGVSQTNHDTVLELKDSRIIYLDQENSGGPSSPRNHGIKRASGKYIAFCDDDDLWMSDKLIKQVKVLEKNHQYGLCYTKMLRFNNEREWAIPHEEGSADFQSLLYVNTVPISSVILRKNLLNQYGFFNETKQVGTSEDYEFLLRYAYQTQFFFLDEYLIKYWSGINRTTSFSGSSSEFILHYKHIIFIFMIVQKLNNIKKRIFLRPALYHLCTAMKNVIYNLLHNSKR